MLLRFGVANHLSIREKQELSLVASSLRDEQKGLIDCPAVPGGKILPAAVIYGANASGKSNVVSAFSFMCRAVLLSHSQGVPGGGVPREPFLLDRSCKKTPSIFDVDFIMEGIRYHYGFETTDEAFDAEWLYAFPKGRRQTLFERNGKNFIFGRELKGRNKIIADLTRANSLFLSAAAQNDHEGLSKVVNFFQSTQIEADISIKDSIASRRLLEKEIDDRVIEFLNKIDTGVTGYRRIEEDLPDNVMEMKNAIGRAIKIALSNYSDFKLSRSDEIDKNVKIQLSHKGNEGEEIFLDLKHESSGTRRLLILLGRIFRVLDEGALLLVDELDASLHTQACRALLELFSSQKVNHRGAQLIATTHDTNLLYPPLLRRDQIWFTEKDSGGATHLYPLTDIKTRKGDNIEKGYLQGRFGAVPFSGSITGLFSTM